MLRKPDQARSCPGCGSNSFGSEVSVHIEADEPHLLYALYTEYESDASGAYTVVLGHKLVSESAVPKQQRGEQVRVYRRF